MSSLLTQVITEKTISKRKNLLSDFMKDHGVGILSDEDANTFREIFTLYYTPENGQEKYETTMIDAVRISPSGLFSTLHFQILVNRLWVDCSVKYLAGSKRGPRSLIE
jgi:hypothetical protein